jgi:hypothetical protein
VARIRTIKHEIWDDHAVGDVSLEARFLFVALITQADDDGRLPGSPKWIDSQVFPYDEDSRIGDIREWIAELDGVDLVIAYEVGGKRYIQIRNWTKHQSIDKRYYAESKLPEPPVERPTRPPRAPDERPDQSHHDRGEDTTPERSGEERKGVERSGEVAPAGGRAAAEPTPISPFAPIVQRLDAVAVARNQPSPKVDAALKVCGEYADLDLVAQVEEFFHYYVEGPGSKRGLDDVVWKWRHWLKRERASQGDRARKPAARDSVSADLRRLEAEKLRLRAIEDAEEAATR